MLAQLASVAGHLISAKGYGGIEDVVAVDPNCASLNLGGKFVGFLNVSGPNSAREAEGGLVGLFGHIIHGGEGDNSQDRSEDFFFGDAHVVVDTGEDSRLDEVALLVLRRSGSTAGQLGAFALELCLHN